MQNTEYKIRELILQLNAMPFIPLYNLNERRYDYEENVLARIEQGKEKALIGKAIAELKASGEYTPEHTSAHANFLI